MTTVLPRSAWTSTAAHSPGELRRPLGLAVHWVGSPVPPSVERAERAAVARFLEAIRRFHGQPGVLSAAGGSDIAYQVAVDQAGREWTCRGFGRRSAANGDAVVNARYGAVVALIGKGQQPTPAMLRGLAHARSRFRERHPTGDKLLTHRDVRPEPTECPGKTLSSWVHDAHGRPPAPPTPPVLLDPTEETTMVIIRHPNGSHFHLTSKGLVWLEAGEVSRISGTEPTVVDVDKDTWQAYRDGFGVLRAD